MEEVVWECQNCYHFAEPKSFPKCCPSPHLVHYVEPPHSGNEKAPETLQKVRDIIEGLKNG